MTPDKILDILLEAHGYDKTSGPLTSQDLDLEDVLKACARISSIARDEALAWQPIETAPRDGTEIDIWLVNEAGNGSRIPDARWVKEYPDTTHEYQPDGTFKATHLKRDGWWDQSAGYENGGDFADQPRYFNAHPRQNRWIFVEATHWMPRPMPPARTNPEESDIPNPGMK